MARGLADFASRRRDEMVNGLSLAASPALRLLISEMYAEWFEESSPVKFGTKFLYTHPDRAIFAGLSDVDFGRYGSEDEDDFRLSGA